MRKISNRSIMSMLTVALVLTMAGTMLGLNRFADPEVLSGAATAEGTAGEGTAEAGGLSFSTQKLTERYSLLWWVLGGVIIALLAVIALWCYLPAGDYE